MQAKKRISIVTPCYNEELNVMACYESIRNLFDAELSDFEVEHIFCDNCSTDSTLSILREIASGDKRVRVIANARNFGAFNSLFNGMLAATGDAIIPFYPADMQDPPEVIPEFVNKWLQGFEIVYGQRNEREESALMNVTRRSYYRLVSKFANIDMPLNVGEFSLVDKKVQQALSMFDDYYPYVRGMIASCGFRSTIVPYRWKARKHGKTTTNLYRLVDAGLNGLISFTNLPMRLCMFAGFSIAALSVFYAVVMLLVELLVHRGIQSPGVPTLIVALFFFSGLNLFFLGFLGEYIGAIHSQVRRRPLVIERERINF